jgi:L-seryl-tRNA(Ser) seleniumtransferase
LDAKTVLTSMELPDSAIARASDIPSVDRLLHEAVVAGLSSVHGRTVVVAETREEINSLREQVLRSGLQIADLHPEVIARRIESRLAARARSRLRPVFNLTGTVLHTNFGRALLPDAAVDALLRAMRTPVNLEFDLDSGGRGDRDSIVESLLCELTGAEAATVVNNNAAAVLLIVNSLANRREVVMSRGELVEIGGAFRMPDVMRSAGAKLIEVGTTNRTHRSDYADALGPRTGLLMKVHTSNFSIEGFTASVDIATLAQVAAGHGTPVAVDLGSGSLLDLRQWGLPREPTVRENIAAGADLVAFSGDKLLGGPQAGIIVGRAELIQRLKRNPLKRALRVGKLTLAALEAVLQLYRSPELLRERLTTLRLLTRAAGDIEAQARRLLQPVRAALGESYEVTATPMTSQIGSGALPVEALPSYGLCVHEVGRRAAGRPGKSRPGTGRPGTLQKAESMLRALPRPVIGRCVDKALWLDLRCLEPDQEEEFLRQLSWLGR